jgi:hypothetical protein
VGGEAPVTPVLSIDSSYLNLSYKPCDNRCLCRRRAVPVMDAFFPSPYCLIFLYLHFTTSLDEEDTALAWWPELTALPTSIFAEMRGLARDETPLPLAMQPKVTALVW